GQQVKVVTPAAFVTLVTQPCAQHLPSRQASFSWQQVTVTAPLVPWDSQMLRFRQQAPLTQTCPSGQPPQRPQLQTFPCGQHVPPQHVVPEGQQITLLLAVRQGVKGRALPRAKQRLQEVTHF